MPHQTRRHAGCYLFGLSNLFAHLTAFSDAQSLNARKNRLEPLPLPLRIFTLPDSEMKSRASNFLAQRAGVARLDCAADGRVITDVQPSTDQGPLPLDVDVSNQAQAGRAQAATHSIANQPPASDVIGGLSTRATATLDIANVNDAPDAAGALATGAEDTTLMFTAASLLANSYLFACYQPIAACARPIRATSLFCV